MIDQFAGQCFMPLACEGGVKSVEQAQRIFASGVEKICIQTAALENLNLVSGLAGRFGSQTVMVFLDVKRNWLGRAEAFQASKGKTLAIDWLKILSNLVVAGAGEVLLIAVDKDGTQSGPDLDLIRQASNRIDVPLIADGGISSLTDIRSAVDAGASAVAAGAFFVSHGPHLAVLLTYPGYNELEQLFADM